MRQRVNFHDPRWFQIAALLSLVLFGLAMVDLSIKFDIAVLIILSVLAIQISLSRKTGSQVASDVLSALISGLSLCLLLRTQSYSLAALAATTAIASKYLFRIDDRHLFNPTAFALVFVTTVFDGAWISPGQWGQVAYLLILIVGMGTFVSKRASRIDTSGGFLLAFAIICSLRACYLGDPITIPIHQLSSGALLIFAFFMISDPRTTPSARCGRLLFAALVALAAAYIEFMLFRPNGAIYALVLCAPLVPIINRIFPDGKYEWTHQQKSLSSLKQPGAHHA